MSGPALARRPGPGITELSYLEQAMRTPCSTIVVVPSISSVHTGADAALSWAVGFAGLAICSRRTWDDNSEEVLQHCGHEGRRVFVNDSFLREHGTLHTVLNTAVAEGYATVIASADDLRPDDLVVNSIAEARAAARKLLTVKRNSDGVSVPGVALRGVRGPDVTKDTQLHWFQFFHADCQHVMWSCDSKLLALWLCSRMI